MTVTFTRRPLERFLTWLTPMSKDPPGLVDTVDEAKRTWKQALDYLNHIDNSLVDYAVHNINATERRYVALIQQARKEGVTAWPGSVYCPLPTPAKADENDRRAGPKEAVNL